MKLPQWLLWSMLSLSVVAVLAAVGWWWVTWPERTMNELHEFCNRQQLCSPELAEWINAHEEWSVGIPKPRARGLHDILCAHQEFDVRQLCHYVVERGRITDVRLFVDMDSGWVSVKSLSWPLRHSAE